uniref:Dissimilatory nitrite reductase n=1 Tax=Macrostomum lignano TaxID=282301 RepID=A0A1I8F5J9_9PLAT
PGCPCDGAAVQLLVRLHLLPGLCAGRLAGRDRRQRVDLRRRQRHVLVHQPGGHDAGGQLLDGGAWGQAAGQGEDLPAAECRPVRRLRRSADAGHLRRATFSLAESDGGPPCSVLTVWAAEAGGVVLEHRG